MFSGHDAQREVNAPAPWQQYCPKKRPCSRRDSSENITGTAKNRHNVICNTRFHTYNKYMGARKQVFFFCKTVARPSKEYARGMGRDAKHPTIGSSGRIVRPMLRSGSSRGFTRFVNAVATLKAVTLSRWLRISDYSSAHPKGPLVPPWRFPLTG